MFRKTLLISLLIGIFIYIPKSYGLDSCEAPSCPTLTISGPSKASYGESKSYTLTSDSSRNIRWSVDNPGVTISGDNNGATLTVGSACDCNNGGITITAKDTGTGCSTTFGVQAGTWVQRLYCNAPQDGIGGAPFCSAAAEAGLGWMINWDGSIYLTTKTKHDSNETCHG